MRTQTALSLFFLTLAGGASDALALNQRAHYQVSLDACTRAGLSTAFCKQVGVEAYNVDANEFFDLAAHSQMNPGQSVCDGASAASWRVFWLGQQVRIAAATASAFPSKKNHNALAQHLGRTLHTLQDNCAHSGMGNPQHAWHSLNDVCRGTHESPDAAPAATECARQESDAVMRAVFDLLSHEGVEKARLADVQAGTKHWTSYGDACSYLASGKSWNGIDRRWDNQVVRPALRSSFIAAVQASSARWSRLGTKGSDGLLASYDAKVDTSHGSASCIAVHVFCLGKADSLEEARPPYEEADDGTDEVPPVDEMPATGCSASGPASATRGASGQAMAGLALVLLALATRRRRG
ncbi:MAG: hypothetical protein EXR72_16130 [Myxococcales bacterium]|nr:hypothetical protein [Myxococcales bacterium]